MSRKKLSNPFVCYFISALLLICVQNLHAVPLDENFDDDPGITFHQNTFMLDGVRYTIEGSYTYSSRVTNDPPLPGDGMGGYYLLIDFDNFSEISSVKIEASDQSSFRLSGLSITAAADSLVTITPYNGAIAGNSVPIASGGGLFVQENIDLSSNVNFHYIDSFTISGSRLVL